MFSSVCVTPPLFPTAPSLTPLASVFYCNYRVAALCGPKMFGNRSIAHCSSLHPAALLAEINGHTLISEASSGRHHSTCNASPTSLHPSLPPLPDPLPCGALSLDCPLSWPLSFDTFVPRSQSTPMANEAPVASPSSHYFHSA